jgi:hypothetical protein
VIRCAASGPETACARAWMGISRIFATPGSIDKTRIFTYIFQARRTDHGSRFAIAPLYNSRMLSYLKVENLAVVE